jgi:hypothetical protein
MSNGKGSKRRPTAIPETEAQDRWAATFGQVLAKPDTTPDTASHEKRGEEGCG